MVSVLLILVFAATALSAVPTERTCEPIRVETCQGLGFNRTSMPNFAGHESQTDADLLIQTFAPLIQYRCSSQLRFFLCSVYVPMCTEKVVQNIGPCRPLCQSVKQRCHPVLVEFGFPWPAPLDCDNFPVHNDRLSMCMEGPGEGLEAAPGPPVPSVPLTDPGLRPPDHSAAPVADIVVSSSRVSSSATKFSAMCSTYRHASEYYYVNRTETCSHRCESDILFSGENKNFAETWLLIWSIVCLLTTGFAICSFLTDSSHFRYPERIIVVMSFTYFMCSLGHFVRLVFGREAISCHQESQHNVSLLITEGPDNFSCTIVFVIVYFFSMSSALWWVNLTVTWLLSAGLNWSPEAIERKSSYLHFVAWLIPAIQTLAILIMRAVDADELTGSCFIGNHSKGTLLAFVIIPSAFYLLLGCFFLFARLYCFYLFKHLRNCSPMRLPHGSHHLSAPLAQHTSSHAHIGHSSCCNPQDTEELRNWKISCFTIFYMLPAFFCLSFHVYEYLERDSWYLNGSPDRPSLELYTIKIFMDFVVGIQSGLWVWSLRTPAQMCGRMWSRFRKSKRVTQPKPVYLISVPAASHPAASLLSPPPSSFSGSSHVPLPTVKQQLLQSHDLDQVSDKSRRRSRSRGGETTV